MKKTQTLAMAFCVVYSLLTGGLATYGETFSDLTITGTATIEALNSGTASFITLSSTTANLGLLGVTGTADISGNFIYFGSWSDDPTHPGLSIQYDDGNNGAGAMITQIATRPLAAWNWQRPGSTVNAMQLDASNRLILSGTATSNPPQIMLDPNGAGISINGNSLLTLAAANALYIPTNSGIVLSDGNVQMENLAIGTYSGSSAPVNSLIVSGSVGIGTTTPQSTLDVAGDIHASGMLIEKKTTFSPSSVGWYRIISAGNFSAGTVRMSKNYNNNITDIEFQYNIWGYGIGGAITVTRAASYCVVDQIRVSSNGGSGVYLDVHIREAATNGAQMTVYGYGPWLDGLQVNPVADAVAGSSSVSVLPIVGKGFATTEAITFGNGSTITGAATTGTTASTPTLVVGGNIQASGGALIEQKITFTPTTVGWYRIINQGNLASGILRIYGNHDNRISEEEIDFYIGYGGGSIQQVRHSNYNGGVVSQVRANRHSTGAVSFDIYVSSATAPRTITIYGFGPCVGGMLANATVGAEPGDKEVRTLTLGDGFRSTNGAIFAETSGYVGIGTSSPQATLDVHGGVRIAGNISVSGSGSLTLADGTVLSSSNTLRSVLANGTASTISGSILANQVTGLAALIPTDNLQLANGAGYITASGTAAFAQTCTTATTLSGTIQTSQIQGIDPVTNGGNLDYSRINNVPSNLVAIATGGTASNVALSGTTRVSGGIIVSGTFDAASNTVVATGSNQLVLIPQQGDLSMGTFTAGKQPQ